LTEEDGKQGYPWYDIVQRSERLEQGDFIDNCEVLLPTYIPIDLPDESPLADVPKYQAKGKTQIYNVVIVSQSCDLENGKLEYVLVCPRTSYSMYKETYLSLQKLNNALEQIRQGKQHRYCMLNGCNLAEVVCETQIVDFGKVFSIPYDIMRQMVKAHDNRLRLRSPYKEKLAQAFAYYYMRIGLPIDIEKHDGKSQGS
jgi:hypothetical protein